MHMQLDADGPPIGGTGLAWSRVSAFVSAVDASLDKWLADSYRLGLTEFRALMFLSQAPDNELRVNDLAQRVGLNPSSTTRLVSRLEAKGLASRDVCQDDGRGVYAVLDEHGEALLHELRGSYEARLQELLHQPEAHFPQFDARLVADALSETRTLVSG